MFSDIDVQIDTKMVHIPKINIHDFGVEVEGNGNGDAGARAR